MARPTLLDAKGRVVALALTLAYPVVAAPSRGIALTGQEDQHRMIRHAVRATVAIAALSLAVLDPPVQAQDKTVPGLHWSEESRQVTSPFATSRKEIPQWKQ